MNSQCWNCGNLKPHSADCVLCGAVTDEDADTLSAMVLDIEASNLALRAKLAHLANKAMKSRCPVLGSGANIVAVQLREIGEDVGKLRERLREDVERKNHKMKAV